jgi:protein gp37
MSDLFHPQVPEDFVSRIWDVMERTPEHQYQILTKRPERMAELLHRVSPAPLPNVWLGTSVEGPLVTGRIDVLRQVPAAIRFVSFEPLINHIPGLRLHGIDWAVVGGESGPRARPMKEEWVDAILEECLASGTAFFFKQWGGVNKKKTGRLLRGQTFDAMPAYSAE